MSALKFKNNQNEWQSIPMIRGRKGEKGDTGETGNSGVYIGTEEPTDDDINVWIDTDGQPDTIGLKYVKDDESDNGGVIEGFVNGNPPNIASGRFSHAEGGGTTASGNFSHAEGTRTKAENIQSHSEGYYTTASGISSHTEGSYTVASGAYGHTEGLYTVANHRSQHVFGEYNIEDDSSSTSSNRGNYIEIIGNGDYNNRSNAYTLDWNGNGVFAGKVTVGAQPTNANDLTTKQYVDNAVGGVSVPVEDVQINGTSILENGVAVLPTKPENNKWGLVRIDGTYGIYALGTGSNIGKLYIDKATSSNIKDGTSNYKPIVASNQHEATFYGLAKASGDSTQSQSSNAVGTYTDEAKTAIKSMLGVAVEDVQINGTSILLNGVANVPVATASNVGVLKPDSGRGIGISTNGGMSLTMASSTDIKNGTEVYKPLPPKRQHESTFYGLAAAAGDTTQSQSSNAVGNYTEEAKTAIRTMLGLEDVYQDYSSAFTALGVI